MCVLDLLGYSRVNWHSVDWHSRHLIIVLSAISLPRIIGYVVLWFYWEGRNWARRLVLITSLVYFWNLKYLDYGSALARMTIILDVAMAVFLLYWLNTVAAKSYFSDSDVAPQA
jgi:hypothetical protein